MAAITYGECFWFGTGCDMSKLPDGFTYRESPIDYAVAVAPDGQEYYIKTDSLILRRVATYARGSLKIGDYYADTENPVKL